MASQAYYVWNKAGRHYTLAQPIQELVNWAKANGVAVLGTIGNEEHLTHEPPQDHTPFSATAWPVKLDGYIVTAIDLANVRELGQLIEDAARAGEYPWLKYMNHDNQHLDSRDLDGDGKTWEEYPSSDKHVHLSIRTDWQHRSIGAFDPFKTGDDDAMFCKLGDKGPKVEAYQRLLLVLDPACLPTWGPDGGYGEETKTAGARLIGGDGTNYGPVEYAALAGKIGMLGAGGASALVDHTHTFDPAAGVSGPAVKA
jgi:hypothetical protein